MCFIHAYMHNYSSCIGCSINNIPIYGCSRFPFASRYPWLWVSTYTGLAFVYTLQCQTGKCDNNSITCQQNDYLSINGHQKTKETSKLKKLLISQKE